MSKQAYNGFATLRERVLDRIERVNGECWIWTGSKDRRGYGFLDVNGERLRAHRVAYLGFIGDIPTGLLVCHSCDVRLCVNPNHLFIGDHRDNNRDARAKGRTGGVAAAQIIKTACLHGHQFDGENLRIDARGHRHCRECARVVARRAYYRRRLTSNPIAVTA